MIKRMKKPISLLLSLLMVVSLFAAVPFTASATAYDALVFADDLQVGDTLVNGCFLEDNGYTIYLKGGTYSDDSYYDDGYIPAEDALIFAGSFGYLEFVDNMPVIHTSDIFPRYIFIDAEGNRSDTIYVLAVDHDYSEITLGGHDPDRAAADTVIGLIDDIGTVEYTPESEALIVAARDAYDALTDTQQALVTNYTDLTDAEAAYAALEAAAGEYVLTVIVGEKTTRFRGHNEDTVTLPAAELPTGYEFEGYMKSGYGTLTLEDGVYTYQFDSGDATLTAKLKQKRYYIHFDGNGNISSRPGNMNDKPCYYDRPAKLTKNGFDYTGMDFVGWNTQPDGSGDAYTDQALVKNLFDENGTGITLYAQWTDNKHEITLVYPDEIDLQNPTYFVEDGGTLTPDRFLNAGNADGHYRFIGSEQELTDITGDTAIEVQYTFEPHDFSLDLFSIEPTCTERGQTYQYCRDCGYLKSTMLPAEHQGLVITEGTVTCTEDGLSDEVKCLTCGEILTEAVELTAFGHIDEDEDGYCDVCGAAHEVVLDFCEGHETLAAAFAQSKGCAVSGSRVTVPVPILAANRWEARETISGCIEPFFYENYGVSSIIDAGERLSGTYELAPQPMGEYADRSAMQGDMYPWMDGEIADGDVFCLLWEQVYTEPITLFVEPLTCNTEVTLKNLGSIASNYTYPQPNYTLTGADTDRWTVSWFDSYDPETGFVGNFATGTSVAGRDYYTIIRIAAPFGYYIADAEDIITVTGAKQVWFPTGYNYAGNVEVVLSVTAEHGTSEETSAVTLEPTESTQGERSFYCADCGALLRTQTLPVLTYYDVTAADDIQGGTVTLSTNRAYVGSTVTVTAEPDEDTFLSRLYYSVDGQEDVTITENDGVYSFIMPDCDVIVHAEFTPTNMVYVDFGAGHESFVQAAFGEAEGLTVDGSVVSFRYVPEYAEADNARGAKDAFRSMQNQYIDYYDAADNGERYMYEIALHPLDYYTETYGGDAETQVQDEDLTLYDTSVRNGITFYALWAQPLSGAVVTVTPPACGTVMTTRTRSSTTQVLPSPEMTATAGLGFEDVGIFYNNWGIGLQYGETTTLTGGNSYTAYGYLTAPWGTFLPDDLTGAVDFEGCTLTEWDAGTRQFRVSVPVYHNFYASDDCTGCGAHAPNDKMSVTIDDRIALNLLLDLGARGVDTSAVTITFNREAYDVEGVAYPEGGEGIYRFTVAMAPAQIADYIDVTIAGDSWPMSATVANYCKKLQSDEYSEYADAQALARAILHYGRTANEVFDYTHNDIPIVDQLDVWTVRDYQGARFSDNTRMVTDVSFMALTKPEFRFYTASITEEQAVAYNAAGVTAVYSGENAPKEKLNARFVKKNVDGETVILIEVTGVSAENMDEEITVTVTDLGTIVFNGNAFARAMANSNNEKTWHFGAALFNYGVAAKKYFKGKPETPAVADNIVDLSTLDDDYEAQNGDVLTGTLAGDYKITIADGAAVTLKDAVITCLTNDAYFAGITPLGDATVILEGANVVKNGNVAYPCIYVPENKTLTIDGTGSLDASSSDNDGDSSCGIGGGDNISAGNIVINGGTITASGGSDAAGIGCGPEADSGYIVINGGTVTATGGHKSAGIGSGVMGSCGDIIINGGTVTAYGGYEGVGIGSGATGSCDDITISGGRVLAEVTYGICPAIGAGREWATCGDILIKKTVTEVWAVGSAEFDSIGAVGSSTCGTVTIESGANAIIF